MSFLKPVFEYPTSHKIFTDGSTSEDGVAAAAVCSQKYKKPDTFRLPNDSWMFTAQLGAILLVLRHNYYSQETSFLILSDSLSSLQAVHDMKYDHPILKQKIHELHSDLLQDEKEIVFVWVPSHVGTRENSAADTAAEDALDGDISDEFAPFSDLKPRMNQYI